MATLSEDIVGGRGIGYGGDGGFGGVGGLLALALLSRGGLLGNERRDCDDCVTNESLNQQTLGDIKASIPYAESQVQLALATAMADLTAQNNANTQTLLVNQFGLEKSIAAVDTNVDRQSAIIQNTIHADGNATRALITENLIAQLNADKVILANKVTELEQESRRSSDRHGIEISMINNQNQNQLQFQQQSQEFNNLRGLLIDACQSIRATNQAINIGGTQLANPTNNNTNVRA